jgi:asparagine synthetase B (glutamine-hydrolysing)
MSTEMLLLAVLASMAVVAMMIAINSRGRWRATISSLLTICLLGATAWVFILHYSIVSGRGGDGGRPVVDRMLNRDRRADSEPAAGSSTAIVGSLIKQADDFAGELLNERLHNPSASHDQLVARASGAELRFEALQSEMRSLASALENFPDAEKLVRSAMDDLKAACHFYRQYYFAENTDAERSTERLLKQKAQSARDTLAKAERAVNNKGF